ncbi:MAG: hypothetical protein [Arizlama microvirus]|nr:MAG: hypothetical protein [Arizlama microvirus]
MSNYDHFVGKLNKLARERKLIEGASISDVVKEKLLAQNDALRLSLESGIDSPAQAGDSAVARPKSPPSGKS